MMDYAEILTEKEKIKEFTKIMVDSLATGSGPQRRPQEEVETTDALVSGAQGSIN